MASRRAARPERRLVGSSFVVNDDRLGDVTSFDVELSDDNAIIGIAWVESVAGVQETRQVSLNVPSTFGVAQVLSADVPMSSPRDCTIGWDIRGRQFGVAWADDMGQLWFRRTSPAAPSTRPARPLSCATENVQRPRLVWGADRFWVTYIDTISNQIFLRSLGRATGG